MEFHDDYPQYELMAHHSEEEGKKKRKKLWTVFGIMLAVTIVELIIGFQASAWGLLNPDRTSGTVLKVLFIGLTLFKAYYIVMSFMHLGDEKKGFKYSILAPYTVFILYLVYIIVEEANYSREHKAGMDQVIIDQKNELNRIANEGGHDGGHDESHSKENKEGHEEKPAGESHH
jgi:cytochrome c oxidase subunit IV